MMRWAFAWHTKYLAGSFHHQARDFQARLEPCVVAVEVDAQLSSRAYPQRAPTAAPSSLR
eukprot:CAMPEP_0180248058 /NCGR_PEP_ID=MMETSP0987-20121128/36505_1 /TAXON_ID=697907 /ORGANISM="non described non described, Strain CCMP2293" /LENGTH=59 /DNA_ID=CAMNT_0022216115 /DNA_START=32 /DNA_END=209 /DNA_ORIENTATION=-